jgi:hypothetical protein
MSIKRWLIAAAALVLGAAAFTVPVVRSASADTIPAGFVQRTGRDLVLDGAPYHFVGFNAFGMAGCATGQPWTPQQREAYFAQLPAASMTRTWAFGRWGIDALVDIVAAAETHGQKLIFSLGESGNGCEQPAKDAAWYQSGYRTTYLAWVEQVVTRFKDSPAIGMWEILNEPGHNSTVDAATMKAFLDDVAGHIRAIDAHHLIESGAMAEYAPGFADFGAAHSGPNVDVGSLHEYDYPIVVSHHLAPTLGPLDTLGKPLIIGEVGVNSGADGCTPNFADRAAALKQKFDQYFLAGVAGVLVWNYTPNPGTKCAYDVRQSPPDPVLSMVDGYTSFPVAPAPPMATARLVARHSGKCLDVADTANGTVLRTNACSSAASQRFTFQATSNGFYRIVAGNDGKCLDVTKQSRSLKAAIEQWDCWGGTNQQFRLQPTDPGYYELIARNSVMCLDVASKATADGTPLQQYDCTGATNQQFSLA